MTPAASRRFEEGRRYLARHRLPFGAAGLADARKSLSALLPEWG